MHPRLAASAQQLREEAEQADQDEIQRDDVVEQARHDQDEHAGDERQSAAKALGH